ncbi:MULTISPECIES: dipeptide ABC transporter ATP-binding protein [Nitrosomonas]|uniref:ATPase component ABC-type dipeptide/oligopeptide/nickel transport system n=1 Tax=Nitrosomonas europaea (strain ATCC 19718 / CIP 103999 / KCTC 2705 / NBRC 14298) TaxID=228410 RepID=Q82S74_NITEU|nr:MULTISPECIES: dipeptide ABC transporter ATP-binding protein [Nitrosomonas]CAD86392.1 ATPase component ABC-type dipeptide/oligopeptide/nickel transport system [Nitrosomonas europaea ATCC 19718]SDW89773.1 peptide/nickel transport system ATP-binding protein [Nitrosomonas europaea]SET43754.1 peptide/nickel transport system ATP-binding protein [Nitrosomonas europaea]SJZ99508.1 peptide/nickel transport system ATP-binding protein [Nitrosomonas europaea]HBF24506.1 dipeptide ABC transporter ATP-bind
MTALLEVTDLRVLLHTGRQPVRAVDGLSLAIHPGETFALLGESGSGKSITALSIMRLLPDAGEIVHGSVRLNGDELLTLPESAMRKVRGNRIGMIFQEPMLSLNPVMTTGAQIGEVLLQHSGLRGAALQIRILELMRQVGIPDPARRMAEYPFQFSGGMKQRVMIAMALAGKPELLIADEPTTALDVTIQAQVLDLMRGLQQQENMAVLLITHDLGVVAEMAHRVAVMYAGQIIETADRERFFQSPAHPYSHKLFAALPTRKKRDQGLIVIPGNVPALSKVFTGCRFADRCDRAWEKCHQIIPPWVETAPQHHVRCHLYSDDSTERSPQSRLQSLSRTARSALDDLPLSSHTSDSTQSKPLLRVDDLKIHFPVHKGLFKRVAGHVKAVDGVSLQIDGGRTLALVGESGCGKTTVGKGIMQLIPVTSGSVRLQDKELRDLDRKQLLQKRSAFQIIFQDPYSSLNPRMRIVEIIEEGIRALGRNSDKIAASEKNQHDVDTLLMQVGLPAEAKWRYPHEFSGGQRQRIAIARALAVDPQLLICDEPTSALDVSVQAQILNLLKTLQQEHKLAYLLITHNIAVVDYLADEVAVMYLGRIVESGRTEEVLDNPKHPYTQALLSAVPTYEPGSQREIIRLQGEPPSPANVPPGCHFHPRCPHVMPICREVYPAVSRFSASHTTYCHLYHSVSQEPQDLQ